MREVDQNFQTLPDNLMAFLAMHVHDKPHSAGIVLEGGVVQSLAAAWIEWKLRLHGTHPSFQVLQTLPVFGFVSIECSI